MENAEAILDAHRQIIDKIGRLGDAVQLAWPDGTILISHQDGQVHLSSASGNAETELLNLATAAVNDPALTVTVTARRETAFGTPKDTVERWTSQNGRLVRAR